MLNQMAVSMLESGFDGDRFEKITNILSDLSEQCHRDRKNAQLWIVLSTKAIEHEQEPGSIAATSF